jgi:hypothetical protein
LIGFKVRRRIRLRIEDFIEELGRSSLTYEEVREEFAKRGFHRPFRKVVEDVLEESKQIWGKGGSGA